MLTLAVSQIQNKQFLTALQKLINIPNISWLVKWVLKDVINEIDKQNKKATELVNEIIIKYANDETGKSVISSAQTEEQRTAMQEELRLLGEVAFDIPMKDKIVIPEDNTLSTMDIIQLESLLVRPSKEVISA